MKKLALVLVLILCATAAQAQWRLNNIGLYLDPADANSWCNSSIGGGIHHVYIVGTNMTALSCKGVEFELEIAGGNPQVSNFVFPPGIDLGGLRDTDHTLAYYDPEPILNTQFIFAEFDLAIFNPAEPTLGFVGAVYFHSLPEVLPAYLDGEDPTLETILPLYNSVGDVYQPDTNLPVLVLNGDCGGVPAEDASWGEVKALFR